MEKTIAGLIMSEVTSRSGSDLYEYQIGQAESLCSEKDQNWEAETTTYFFKDRSRLIDNNGQLKEGV
ncbi:MAG: hypothetical protein ACYDBI_05995 [Thermoplasmataceae archaeon]